MLETCFLIVALFVNGEINQVSQDSGYIYSYQDIDTVYITTDQSPLYLIFETEEDADFWINVYGEKGNLLEKVCLLEKSVIKLKGGGSFLMEIYSEGNFGWWKFKYCTRKEYRRVYK
jgi:hypothetical protein